MTVKPMELMQYLIRLVAPKGAIVLDCFNGKTASFNNSYFCYKMLPKDLIFCHLENNNSNKYFEPSRMLIEYQNEIDNK